MKSSPCQHSTGSWLRLELPNLRGKAGTCYETMPVPHRSGRDVGCLSTNTMSGSNSFICMCGLKPAHQVQTTSKGGRKGQIDRPKSIKPQPDKRPRTRNVPPQATPTVFAKSSSDTTSESHKDEIHGRVLPRQFSCGHGYMGYHNGSVRGYEAPTEYASHRSRVHTSSYVLSCTDLAVK